MKAPLGLWSVVVGLAMGLPGCAESGTWEGVGTADRGTQALDFEDTQFVVQGFPKLYFDLAGRGLNGQSLNGKPLDGRRVVAVSLEGVRWHGEHARSLRLMGTSFHGARVNGNSVNNMVGAEFTAMLDDGDGLDLRIDAAVPSADPAQPDVVRYAVSYATAEQWWPLCGWDQSGQRVLAVPLEGQWDYRQGVPTGGAWVEDDQTFTFACDGFVLAKCVDMGYAPWRRGRASSPGPGHSTCAWMTLRDHHQACTRALRADYCGDGTSFTVDALDINLHDGLGIRQDNLTWWFEAEWNDAGAVCVDVARASTAGVPPCWWALQRTGCGAPSGFGEGTLLMTEFAPD